MRASRTKVLLEHESPLYGRIDLALELKPMDYYDAAKFYPAFSPEDKVRLYSVFGGIPYYNRLVSQALSVRENIIELMTEPGARLENEIPSYLGAEISKMTNANEVFGALAQGYSRWGDVLAQSHVSSGPAMSDVLEKLISLELVQKRAPINDPANKTSGEFDVVTRDPKGYVFYEAKFRKTPVTQKIVDEEIAQVEATGLKCHRHGFFSRSGFAAAESENTVFIDLAQMFE